MEFSKNTTLTSITFSIFLLNLIYSLTLDYIIYENKLNIHLSLLLLLINTLTIYLCFIYYHVLKEQQHITKIQKQNLRLENLEAIQAINENNYQSLRNWKHDIIHIFSSIKYQLSNQNYKQAIDIIDSYNKSLSSNNFMNSSGNEFLDYLLLQKNNLIKQHNIHLITNCISDIAPLDDTHFFIIMGNLLDNAIENCSSNENKQLWITLSLKPGYFCICIKNTISQSVLQTNPNLNTTKDNAMYHGIGIKTVKYFVKHYRGSIKFEEEDNYFIIKILIPKTPV